MKTEAFPISEYIHSILGTAIAPVLNIFLQGLSNFKLQFIVIFIISFIALVFSIFYLNKLQNKK